MSTLESITDECMKILKCKEKEHIKKCYYKLAMILHPDKINGDEEQFKKIQCAYDLLTHDDKLEKELDERILKENALTKNQQKINIITEFLDANNCEYEKEKPLAYYEKIQKDIYEKIFFLLEYRWEMNWWHINKLNAYILDKIRNIIQYEKYKIFHLYGMDPYQLNVDKLYNRAFLLHIIEERLYTLKVNTNNQLVDLLNFLEYSLEKTPSWEIII